ncbi:RDD family protein [Heyndrickxia ginsengihumi]
MEVRPAGFWIRLCATIIDSILITIVSAIFFWVKSSRTKEIIQTTLELLYDLIVPVAWNGFTVGKRVCRIRIVKVDGSKITFKTVIMRYIVGCFVYTITFGLGAIVSAFMVGLRKDKRAIHDFIAGTHVIYD